MTLQLEESPIYTESPPRAPFPYFGAKSRVAATAWAAFGEVKNYVEPFAGSLAVLLARPQPFRGPETVNDKCGFIANFWRSVSADPDAVAYYADWPVSEIDLEARHGWLVNRSEKLREWLADPDWFDAKIAGWWCWGACAWIGPGWCEGRGPWESNGASITKRVGGVGINRGLPHLSAGVGINRGLPHLSAGRGVNRQLPHLSAGRGDFIRSWFDVLHARLRDVRVACGDWSRVVTPSVTTRHGLTAVFLDPPYAEGEQQYAAGGTGTDLSADVRKWCVENASDQKLRIILCGHAGEHDELESIGWRRVSANARKGYARTAEAVARSDSDSLWLSPTCVQSEQTSQLIAS